MSVIKLSVGTPHPNLTATTYGTPRYWSSGILPPPECCIRIFIFKALVIQALYNLSDEQAEYQVRDRLSFMRFLGLGIEDRVPDATTLWLYREALAKAGTVAALFADFNAYLKERAIWRWAAKQILALVP